VSTQTFILGQEVQHKEQLWLVVRIVESTAIFENEDLTISKVEERYVQLRAPNGEYDFIVLHENEEPFKRVSVIKALPPVPWRMKK